MYAEMDRQCCLWLDGIANKVTSKKQKQNILAFKMLLQEYHDELDEFRGKYIAMRDGLLLPFSFHQPGDACEDGIKDAYLFFVPTEDRFCDSASMFTQNTHTIQMNGKATKGRGSIYSPPLVNVTLTMTCDGKEVKKKERYLVDTGATDTSCPRAFVQMDDVKEAPRQQPSRMTRLLQWATGYNPMHENHDEKMKEIVPF